ncbi:MAG: SMI1/KNR4 family protein [Sarcina sp.]
MSCKYSELIEWAKKNGWKVEERGDREFQENRDLNFRFNGIPNQYYRFLEKISGMISPNEKTWFLCENEYNNNSKNAFNWNEFELISLEAAEEDVEWKSEIISWWNKKFPIVMSVDNGYSFYAIDLSNNKGNIVRGFEPEFEDVEVVAENIDIFFELIMSKNIKF